jgi:hypothetical protein
MNLAVRWALVGLGSAVLAWGADVPRIPLFAGSIGAAGALSIAHFGRLRPASDLLGWLALAWIAWNAELANGAKTLALTLSAILWLAACLVPPAGAPPVRAARVLLSLSLTALFAGTLLWLPFWQADGRSIAIQDPLSAAGIALRVLVVLTAAGVGGWAVAAFQGLRRRRRERGSTATPGMVLP